MLLAALPELKAHGLPAPTTAQVLQSLGVSRSRAYELKARLEALHDAGFYGFRVILFLQTGGLNQVEEGLAEAGLKLDLSFFICLVLSIMIGGRWTALAR